MQCVHIPVLIHVYPDIITYYLLAACSECPVGSEPVVGFEYKWWNTMPKNMRSAVFRREFSDSQQITGETQRFTRIAQLNSQKAIF